MEHISSERISELDRMLSEPIIDLKKADLMLHKIIRDFWEDKNLIIQLYKYRLNLVALSENIKPKSPNYYWGNVMTYEQAKKHLSLGN